MGLMPKALYENEGKAGGLVTAGAMTWPGVA